MSYARQRPCFQPVGSAVAVSFLLASNMNQSKETVFDIVNIGLSRCEVLCGTDALGLENGDDVVYL